MRLAALFLLWPSLGFADSLLDLETIPDLTLLEPVYHLDRGEDRDRRTTNGVFATVGAGFGTFEGEKGAVGQASLVVGQRSKRWHGAVSSEATFGGNDFVRGLHKAMLELRTQDKRGEDEIGGIFALGSQIEHGHARRLSPVWLGPGRRNHAAGEAEAIVRLEPDKEDLIWCAVVTADGSITKWLDAPLMDRAYRGAAGLGVSFIPNDDELPRGRLDIVRARIQHANIKRTFRAAGIPLHDTQVRTIDIMGGLAEFTAYEDREILVGMTAQFGASWIESDAIAGRITDTMFKMDLGIHMKWLKKRKSTREFGFGLARDPGPTADGQHHVSDWRLEMISSTEDRKFVFTVRGGITWITHVSGGIGDPDTIKRYGSHIEGYIKMPYKIEVGGYHAMAFEPPDAGDPFVSQRAWSYEAGLVARYRMRMF